MKSIIIVTTVMLCVTQVAFSQDMSLSMSPGVNRSIALPEYTGFSSPLSTLERSQSIQEKKLFDEHVIPSSDTRLHNTTSVQSKKDRDSGEIVLDSDATSQYSQEDPLSHVNGYSDSALDYADELEQQHHSDGALRYVLRRI